MKPAAPLPPGLYGADQLEPGDWFMTDSCEVTAAMITAFADLTGDRTEFHLSAEAALQNGFGGQVAHGLLVLDGGWQVTGSLDQHLPALVA